ncbi:MAG: hypothetical protein J5843_01995 [Clostridia bacterium]|nr:hypothetical protein [Clostridia bacterium]
MKKTPVRLWQWTWGFPQTFAGFWIFLFFKIFGRRSGSGRQPCRTASFRHTAVTGWSRHSALSLGMFLFVPDREKPEFEPEPVWIHEFGHAVQSCILGPLFLPVIGLPSLLWASLFKRYRAKKQLSYYRFYPEKWANREGERVTGRQAPKN